MVCAVILLSASFGTVEARKVYIDELDSGTKIYVDDDSIYGEPEKFSVTLYFDDEATTIFTPDPNGKRRAFIVDEAARVRVKEATLNLCSEP